MINCKVCDSKLEHRNTSLSENYRCLNDSCVVYSYHFYKSYTFIEIENYILHLYSYSHKGIVFITDSFDDEINKEFFRNNVSSYELFRRENCFDFLIKFKENLLLL